MSQKTTNPVLLGERGRGQIGPAAHGLTTESVKDVVDRLLDDISYDSVLVMQPGCVDGRREICGVCLAGGILTVAVGYIVTHGVKPGETIVDILRHLQELGFKIVLHEGCGALKKFMAVMELLAQADEEVYSLMNDLGIEAPLHLRDQLARAASELPENFMVSEEELFEAVRSMGGTVERFSKKDHREVCACVNWREGTSLRREVLDGVEGDPQTFELDAWAIPVIAKELTDEPEGQKAAMAAMVFYNCGVVEELGDKDLGIYVRE